MRFVIEAEDLDIEILGFKPEQPVAHAAAHEPWLPAGLTEGVQSGDEWRRQNHALGRFHAVKTSIPQPASRASPPSGVSGQMNFIGPPKASQ